MIAAFQMYDWTEVRSRTDRFWAAVGGYLRDQGIGAPVDLTRADDIHAPWPRHDLLLGQTCGLPYVSGRCGEAILVGRPDYGIEGAEGGEYRSALVCRADDGRTLAHFRGARAAINDLGSQSGCNALADSVNALSGEGDEPFFGSVVLSGAHRKSATLVADGDADIAAIDGVAWALFGELEPERHARLRMVGWSRACPALPFITAPGNREILPVLTRGLAAGIDAVAGHGIPTALMPASDEDYDPVRNMADSLRGFRLSPDTPPL